MAVGPDGAIVVSGIAGSGAHCGNGMFAVSRYSSDGSLDTAFGGGDGIATANFTSSGDFGFAMALQTDGKVVVAGPSGVGSDDVAFALARFDSDGSLEATFGSVGKVVTDVTPSGDWANGVAIQADGKIVVSGNTGSGGNDTKFGVARYRSDGTSRRDVRRRRHRQNGFRAFG